MSYNLEKDYQGKVINHQVFFQEMGLHLEMGFRLLETVHEKECHLEMDLLLGMYSRQEMACHQGIVFLRVEKAFLCEMTSHHQGIEISHFMTVKMKGIEMTIEDTTIPSEEMIFVNRSEVMIILTALFHTTAMKGVMMIEVVMKLKEYAIRMIYREEMSIAEEDHQNH